MQDKIGEQKIILQELRELILEVLADNETHTRQELIAYAKEKYGMKYYDADARTASAIKSLIKKGDLVKLEKGIYQLENDCQEIDNGVQMEQKM